TPTSPDTPAPALQPPPLYPSRHPLTTAEAGNENPTPTPSGATTRRPDQLPCPRPLRRAPPRNDRPRRMGLSPTHPPTHPPTSSPKPEQPPPPAPPSPCDSPIDLLSGPPHH